MNVTQRIKLKLRGCVDLRIPRIFDVSCRICFVYLGDLMHHQFYQYLDDVYIFNSCMHIWMSENVNMGF